MATSFMARKKTVTSRAFTDFRTGQMELGTKRLQQDVHLFTCLFHSFISQQILLTKNYFDLRV